MTPEPEGTESTKSANIAPSETPLSVAEVPPAATAPATDLYYADGEAGGGSAPVPAPGLPPVRVLEIALAMLTVLLGLGAWLARRAP
jgi:hypothetical protein